MTHGIADRFRETMRRTASGVAILTTDGAAGRAGITVSTLCSLSMEPPSVVACVHRDNRALETIMCNGVFAANVLADDQESVAKAFAGMIPELREDRFASGRWQPAHPRYTAPSPPLTARSLRHSTSARIASWSARWSISLARMAIRYCSPTEISTDYWQLKEHRRRVPSSYPQVQHARRLPGTKA